MKRMILLIAVLACILVLAFEPAQAQLNKPITRNNVTAAIPEVPFDSIGVSTLYAPKGGGRDSTKLIPVDARYSIFNWSATDSLHVVQSTADTASYTTFLVIGPRCGYSTPKDIPLVCLKIRGTNSGVKYSLVIQ